LEKEEEWKRWRVIIYESSNFVREEEANSVKEIMERR
jgi:hypothetical protein